MEVLVLNKDFQGVSILDTFESLIWTDRYAECGDFEISTVANSDNLTVLQKDYYLWMRDSEHVMIIEDREIDTDDENAKHLILTGRSLESIIDRRIIWQQTILTGNLQNGIKKLLDENIIVPVDPDRKIDNFIFEASDDPAIVALTVNTQFTGDNLLDAIQILCESNQIGFKVTLSEDNKFIFKLYAGKDRTYDQIENPYVIFSPNYENLINSNYLESNKSLRTVTLVAGEGEGLERKSTVVGGGSNLNRRELYTDARDLQMEVDGIPLTDAEYLAQLEERGIEKLSAYQSTQAFEGEAENTTMFQYGEDFFMGDIVQIENEYGITSKSRVAEVIRSQNNEGINIFPTFTAMDDFTIESSGVLNPGQPKPKYATLDDIPESLPANGGNADTLDNKHASDFMNKIYANASVVGSGWYRVAKLAGPAGRGDSIVGVHTTGGSYVPYTLIIKFHKTWSNIGTIIAEMLSGGYWSGVRLVQDAVDTNAFYLEVYFTQAITGFVLTSMDTLGYNMVPELMSGVLVSGNGTVLVNLEGLVVGINTTGSVKADGVVLT